ncbi:MAG: hypothetical protein RMY16_31965 [Nostoc sp. DedQUE12b]|uniref:hypothetical protein n=1 Tax=Nostoc sp. DedQUE12b TaxID=3075398 RepID=UPI002AD33856|nr:hypothetical protein [Nostoc sp. DedQUE12b]MDZ8090135.1 hypothetical protein [Nostoc sp. DedQUE12b]
MSPIVSRLDITQIFCDANAKAKIAHQIKVTIPLHLAPILKIVEYCVGVTPDWVEWMG